MIEHEDEKARNEAAQVGRTTQLVKTAHRIEVLGISCIDRYRTTFSLNFFFLLSLSLSVVEAEILSLPLFARTRDCLCLWLCFSVVVTTFGYTVKNEIELRYFV
ncbi:hypothetical protein CIPAW_03G078500 [Carya illinoinensis]|uniref:Uncharacterized protein n=1 Tax=Carya illinoinensis TaxID=32201 RepID=A0A8T1R138_CARIL|nr:hypothetical protein CIPAW_03G078500 [Carya illinoinensis]